MAFHFAPLELTPLDHTMPICYIAFFYAMVLDDPQQGVPVLEEGLRRLLKECPFLAGNMIRPSSKGSKANVREVQPPTPDSLHEFPILRVAHHTNQYITKKVHNPGERVSSDSLFNERYLPLPLSVATRELCPIIRWQANILQDGIFLAVCFHHSVFDAAGFYFIQDALARCCREHNCPTLTIPLGRDLLEGRRRMVPDPMVSEAGGEAPAGDSQTLKVANFNSVEGLVSRRLILQPASIEYLKGVCNAILHDQSQGQYLTSNDMISALLWLAIIRARYESSSHGASVQDNQPTQSSLILITEIRRTLKPPLPFSYMGNGIIQSATTSPVQPALGSDVPNTFHPQSSDLTKGDVQLLVDLALKVHAAQSSVDNAYVKGIIQEKQRSIDWSPTFKQGDITSTSIRRMGIYGLDFGTTLGRVVEFDSPDNRIDGTVCILPARSTSILELRVTLPPNIMLRLLQGPLLRWAMRRTLGRL
ncbi:transferase family-domain-containing protein [Aspergillus pseudotamarii]|uniref:Transferase family-domain-containing protein n=1 Tax=Aspergillus pseudotamarii TaxID=132259 RepID=A0A5N6SWR5_ASPPS|nr:transferase family-domain-containing protein [Aspergillus pseudotamarii]KAE8139062.1 transferase family-domain-containing protein [Aspergillus pseudotamarii]